MRKLVRQGHCKNAYCHLEHTNQDVVHDLVKHIRMKLELEVDKARDLNRQDLLRRKLELWKNPSAISTEATEWRRESSFVQMVHCGGV